jgi:hypothetical protein
MRITGTLSEEQAGNCEALWLYEVMIIVLLTYLSEDV